ncbi:MAG: hypothetical protein J5981_07235, partial [Lachnospira sp.]|nr:hypothetical protein [Lachnospira sp.]
ASKTFTSTEQKELVNTMAKALGVTVQYQDIPSANGMYKDGKIYISNKTINPSMVVMSHELTHHLKATVAEEYTAYENYVIDYFKEYHAKEYNVLYNAMTEQYGNDDAIIREEIAANAAETFLTDAEAVNRFVKQNRTIAEKIADFLNNFITKLKELYQGYKAQGKAGKMLAEDIEVYEKARDLWYEAVNVGQGKNNRTDSEKSALGVQFPSSTTQNGSKNNLSDEQQNGKTKFSLKPYSEHQIKNWSNSKNIVLYQNDEQYKQFIEEAREHKLGAKKIYFGTVSDYLAEQVMEKLGLDIEGYNCTLRAYEIEKIFKSHGNEKKERQRGQRAVTVEDLLKIPNIMGQPDSVTRNAEDKYEGKPAFHIKKDGYTLFVVIQDKHLDLFLQTMFVSENKKSLATAIDVQASILTPETTSGTASENSITPNHENDKQKFSLKVYTDEIGIRFSDKDGGDLFESILMGTDNVDYQSVLWDDGSESYRATMDLINESARILQDGITAAGKLKDFNVTRDMAQAMAAHYLNKYSATFNEDTLTNNLFNIFAYMQNTEDVNYQDMIRLMQEVCKPVIATSQKIDKEMMKQYNEFRKFVRSYHIKLNAEQKAEIASVYDSFRTFKNVNQNKYTFRENGSYLDTVWSDLVEASGYALSYDTPSSEQMLALHDYMTALEKSIISPAEDMDNSQVAYDMALNIYTDYFKLIGEDKQAIKNLRTQMQKKLNEYKRDVREDYKDRFKKYKEETTIKTQDEINRLQKQIRQLERERDDALYTADDITINILDGNINALEYKIGKLSQRNADKLAKLTAQSYNRSVQRAITRQQTEIKNHIKKNMFDLQNRLAKPKENKFIPQGLVKATIDLCEAVNIDTGKSQRLAERLGEMSHLYARMKDDKDYALSSEYDDQTQKAIDRLR